MITGQGSELWFAERCGKVTASRIADVVARTKTGWGAGRKNYMAQLIAERLSGEVAESYSNAAMQWGTDHEPDAAAAYAFLTGHDVAEVGFVPHPEIEQSGASPDRLVNDDGLVEIKCPNTATHIDTLLGAPIDKKYRLQMQWQMRCTDRAWCDFASYDPRLPVRLSLHIRRVDRDDKLIAELESDVREFISEMEDKINRLQNETGDEQ